MVSQVKAKAQQTSFDMDFRPRNPVVHEHHADFTTMEIGAMAGEGCRILVCPRCNHHCIALERANTWRFIHTANIQSTARFTKLAPVIFCSMDSKELETMRDLGLVTCNRLGQILEVK